jgi:hypothetical protein
MVMRRIPSSFAKLVEFDLARFLPEKYWKEPVHFSQEQGKF